MNDYGWPYGSGYRPDPEDFEQDVLAGLVNLSVFRYDGGTDSQTYPAVDESSIKWDGTLLTFTEGRARHSIPNVTRWVVQDV